MLTRFAILFQIQLNVEVFCPTHQTVQVSYIGSLPSLNHLITRSKLYSISHIYIYCIQIQYRKHVRLSDQFSSTFLLSYVRLASTFGHIPASTVTGTYLDLKNSESNKYLHATVMAAISTFRRFLHWCSSRTIVGPFTAISH